MKDATNQLAKMHFNINMEKAKRFDLECEIAGQELREAKLLKQEAEVKQRKSTLDEATNFNTQMQATIKSKVIMDRQTFVQEKDNIQTSLKSQVVETAQENFKFAVRKQGIQDSHAQNMNNKYMQTQNHFAHRNLQLQDEQKWLQQINSSKANEDSFLRQQRTDQIRDLRDTYKAQQAEKNERARSFMKN